MFKSAATKIAHNSTIPALAGNQELRPLQDLITAEKALLLSFVFIFFLFFSLIAISLQKLNIDFSKSSETLRTWAISEGDDLAVRFLLLPLSFCIHFYTGYHRSIRNPPQQLLRSTLPIRHSRPRHTRTTKSHSYKRRKPRRDKTQKA